MEKCQVVLYELLSAGNTVLNPVGWSIFMAHPKHPWSEVDYAEASEWMQRYERVFIRLLIKMEV